MARLKFVITRLRGRSSLSISHYDRNGVSRTRLSESQVCPDTEISAELIRFSYYNRFTIMAPGGSCQGIDGLEACLELAASAFLENDFLKALEFRDTWFCVSSL